jgi:hypothetical protein
MDPTSHEAAKPRISSAVALLVVASVSTLVGWFLAVPAVILGVLAVASQGTPSSRSATLARWGWIAYVAAVAVTLLYGVALIAVAFYAASGNS